MRQISFDRLQKFDPCSIIKPSGANPTLNKPVIPPPRPVQQLPTAVNVDTTHLKGDSNMKRLRYAMIINLLLVAYVYATETNKAIVIYDDKATDVGAAKLTTAKPNDLWITLADLKSATRFENKPQGVCRDELCFPLPKKRRADFLQTEGKTTWFNLTEFARLVKQPVAHDAALATWYFGLRPEVQNSYTNNFKAPNFTLPDKDGKLHSLSDFRGKKVLIVTWASW
jgi:hypothetical protein